MSIGRPSHKDVEQFLIIQQGKKFSGNWYPHVGPLVLLTGVSAIFLHSLHRSQSPSGIVPRILYERSLSPFMRSFRHLAPPLIVLGSLVSWDLYSGLWSDKK